MTQRSRRLVRRSASLAALLALGVAGTAHADITGTVRNSAGVPLPGVSVRGTETNGSSAGFDVTDANGQYTLGINTSFDTPPFTVTGSISDQCRDFGSNSLETSVPGLGDGAVQDLTLDPYLFCAPSFISSSDPQPTGHVWQENGRVLVPRRGRAYLRVLAASGASGFQLTLDDGSVVGQGDSASQLLLTAPNRNYDGPLNLTYNDSTGATSTRQLATLVVGRAVNPKPPSGVFDLLSIVDVSGSMGGTDPTFRRKDAVQLLVELAGNGDRVGAVGFDNQFKQIFPRTTISGNAVKARLKRLARARIVNRGGTDYNVAFESTWDEISGDPLKPAVPKAAIFLTDGGHGGGTYDNAHLRFAFNGSGRAWPVCVVQLGRSFNSGDVARLKRIATDTGGIYVKAPTNAQLESLYFRCRGRTAGEQTLLRRGATYRIGQTRSYLSRVAPRQRRATFFVSWEDGRYRLVLRQPGGRIYRRSVGKRVRLVRGKTFAFFQVTNPKRGRWRLSITRLPSGDARERATTTITVRRR